MAISLTQAQLSSAIRLGDSAEEVAESTRLLAFATEAISRHLGDAYDGAPETIVNEAAIRLAGYFYDQPNAGRGLSFANAGRNSGAWAILLPFRVHRAGTTGDAVAAAQEAVGLTGNPVVDVALTTDELIVSFADGTVETTPFTPGSGGGGIDQPARDAAAAAQAEIDAHEASPHTPTPRPALRRRQRKARRTQRKPISTRTKPRCTTPTPRPALRRRQRKAQRTARQRRRLRRRPKSTRTRRHPQHGRHGPNGGGECSIRYRSSRTHNP